MRSDRCHHMNRSGFSLIELLVAITIMLLLIGTLVSFMGTIGGSAREAATKVTITKLDSLLQARLSELNEMFREQEAKKLNRNEWINVNSGANGATVISALTSGAPVNARVAYCRLDRYVGMFPQREEDLYGPNGTDDSMSGGGDDSPLLGVWLTTPAPPHFTPGSWRAFHPTTTTSNSDRSLESSELLTLALTFPGPLGKSKGGGAQIADSINPRHFLDKDGNGLPELYDDWGQPLRFYNAPTRLLKPAGADTVPTTEQVALARALVSGLPPAPTAPPSAANLDYFQLPYNQDPFDSKGGLRRSGPPSVSRWLTTNAAFELRFHTADTYYAPLIVSCGGDESLGLGEPTATTTDRHAAVITPEEAADSITNLQTSGGGR